MPGTSRATWAATFSLGQPRDRVVARRFAEASVHHDDDHLGATLPRLPTAARTAGTIARSVTSPRTLSRSHTLAPGVVAPTIPMRAPARSTMVHPRYSRLRRRGRCWRRETGSSPGLVALEKWHAIVELVIAHCGRVVPHYVHGANDGPHRAAATRAAVTRAGCPGGCPLRPRARRAPDRRAQRIHDGRRASEPARVSGALR